MAYGELEAIVAESRVRNNENAITGVLLAAGGNFMQMLEGPRQSLDETMVRIRSSRRHTGIIELVDEPVSVREFDDWSMAFTHAEADKFMQLRNASWVREGDHLSAGRELLRQFWRNTARG
jgi:hypothetical protein